MITAQDRATLSALLDYSPQPVWVHQDGVLVYVNRALIALLGGQDEKDLLGRHHSEFFAPASRERIRQRTSELLDDGQLLAPAEHQMLRLDGSTVVVEGLPWRIDLGGRPAIQATFTDLTARRLAAFQ